MTQPSEFLIKLPNGQIVTSAQLLAMTTATESNPVPWRDSTYGTDAEPLIRRPVRNSTEPKQVLPCPVSTTDRLNAGCGCDCKFSPKPDVPKLKHQNCSCTSVKPDPKCQDPNDGVFRLTKDMVTTMGKNLSERQVARMGVLYGLSYTEAGFYAATETSKISFVQRLVDDKAMFYVVDELLRDTDAYAAAHTIGLKQPGAIGPMCTDPGLTTEQQLFMLGQPDLLTKSKLTSVQILILTRGFGLDHRDITIFKAEHPILALMLLLAGRYDNNHITMRHFDRILKAMIAESHCTPIEAESIKTNLGLSS